MHRFRCQRYKIPEGVVRGRALRKSAVGFHLHGMDHVGELDRILNEEDRNVVTYQVPVAFLGVELDGKSAHVAWSVDRTGTAGNRRETGKQRRLFPNLGKYFGGRIFRQRFGQLKVAMYRCTARVNDTFRDTLVIEMGDLFTKDEILQQHRATRISLERVLIVGNRDALVCCKRRMITPCDLMELAAIAYADLSVRTS